MKFTAAMAFDIKSDEELIVFCHGERRVLVPLPGTYEDAEDLVKEEFAIDGPIQFETDELAECDGARVQLRQDTWRTASMLSAQMYVRELAIPRNERMEPRENILNVVQSPRSVRSNDQIQFVKREPESGRLSQGTNRRNAQQQPQCDKTDKGKARALPTRPNSPKLLTPESSTSSVDANTPAAPTVMRTAPRTTHNNPNRESAQAVQIKIEDTRTDTPMSEDDDDDSDVPMESAAEDWPEDDEDDAQSDVEIKQEDEDDGQWLADSTGNVQTPMPVRREPAVETPRRRSRFVATGHQQRTSPQARVKIEKTSPVVIKKSKAGSSRQALAAVDQNQVDPDVSLASMGSVTESASSFCISIQHGERKVNFRTRPSHTVRDVLKSICPRFGLRDRINKTRLVMMQDVQDRSFDMQCEAEHTMEKLKAGKFSKFRIDFDTEPDSDEE
ncbi:hypothetical protein EIP91_011950 [Steccherinum ochraceum]|uniref:Uncharacterized protein n=1 Tax=Steccherinum ochraceum TaxID=92696 RepID=A0A4R0RXL5_9APHY|nr:hypothetical protein EIP91_011950 [Steccherinum ochraceum]